MQPLWHVPSLHTQQLAPNTRQSTPRFRPVEIDRMDRVLPHECLASCQSSSTIDTIPPHRPSGVAHCASKSKQCAFTHSNCCSDFGSTLLKENDNTTGEQYGCAEVDN
eukprot:gb/GECG01000320.1/.p1 GENE.gb/GECG01000320.1/~~gb/GECG01000320.1/.p1  ORF type:complete len:108 (+),score=9.61 gb/GECG01000320.1/:1-324(+)